MGMHFLVILSIYFVSFLDKPEKAVPALSDRAIEQRQKWDIPTDEMDYPVSQLYQSELVKIGAKILHTSRWMNGATVEMSEKMADKVRGLTFVTAVEMTRTNSLNSVPKHLSKEQAGRATEAPWKRTDDQLDLYNLRPLHEAGYEGQGIVMAICDCGFFNANTLSCFRQNELELGHFDFTDDGTNLYGSNGTHGEECLSVISGMASDFHGAATQAPYYLMRSEEYYTESPKELDNLVVALETADSLGVNIFSVSLGYYKFDNREWNLTHDDLDGQTTRASRAATIAARKGMLVCVAAGNEGDKEWEMIDVPADADSVLTVGAVSTSGEIGYFSSHGPAADGRVKPEVCAVGVATELIDPNGNAISGNGTSFATPLLAGMAASLWSALPNENAMQIRERIIRSADRYPLADKHKYGYGIPDAWKAYTMTTAIDEVQGDKVQCTKVLRGEEILIVRHGHVYNLAGQRVQ